MRFLRLLSLASLCTVSSYALSQSTRLDLAKSWLNRLGMAQSIPTGSALANLSPTDSQVIISALGTWTTTSPMTQLPPSTKTPPAVGRVRFEDLSSTLSERVMRTPQVKLDSIETAKYVYGVPQGSTGMTASFISNPDSVLFNYSATLNLSEAFLSVSDRTTACQAKIKLVKSGVDVIGNEYCVDFDFLSGSRRRDEIERMFSAISLTYTASQNSKTQSRLIFADAPVSFSHSVTGSFDPAKMWRTASDWASVAASSDDFQGNLPCWNVSSGCFQRYLYGWQKIQYLEILIPKVDVKVITPLNFQASGTTLIFPPTDEKKVLYTVSATIDLAKFIPNAKARSSAADVISSISDKERKRRAALAWRTKVADMYGQLLGNPLLAADEVWWEDFRMLMEEKPQ